MLIDDVFTDINAFIEKKKEELRNSLRQAQPGNSTIGISCDDQAVLDYVPTHGIVEMGTYISNDAKVYVEMLRQDPATGLIHLEVLNETEESKRFDYISTGMFERLFSKAIV